jgi:hypothetical protein
MRWCRRRRPTPTPRPSPRPRNTPSLRNNRLRKIDRLPAMTTRILSAPTGQIVRRVAFNLTQTGREFFPIHRCPTRPR